LDESVAAVWKTMLNGQGNELIRRIGEFEVSKESVREVLDGPTPELIDQAFATIIRNRVQRGGILAPGASLMKTGENGRGLLSRWYPATLQSRIRDIGSQRHKITFTQGDGIAWLKGQVTDSASVFFIDPPYTVAGRRLYRYSDIDHEELFEVAATLTGDFLMTYDDAEPIQALAMRHGLDAHSVPMKNTHHRIMRELLIGRNLDWARQASSKFRQDALFELGEGDGPSGDQTLN
jgi:DNA adenine methylase